MKFCVRSQMIWAFYTYKLMWENIICYKPSCHNFRSKYVNTWIFITFSFDILNAQVVTWSLSIYACDSELKMKQTAISRTFCYINIDGWIFTCFCRFGSFNPFQSDFVRQCYCHSYPMILKMTDVCIRVFLWFFREWS